MVDVATHTDLIIVRVWKREHTDTEHDDGNLQDEHVENHSATDTAFLDEVGLEGERAPESGTSENNN